MSAITNRLRLLSLIIILFALLLVAKLYFLQIISGDEFKARAEHQYVAGINFFDRGSIFFTTKDGTLVPAATVKLGFILHINPTILRESNNIEEVYQTVDSIIPVEREAFFAKANKTSDPYEEIARRVDAGQADRIQA